MRRAAGGANEQSNLEAKIRRVRDEIRSLESKVEAQQARESAGPTLLGPKPHGEAHEQRPAKQRLPRPRGLKRRGMCVSQRIGKVLGSNDPLVDVRWAWLSEDDFPQSIHEDVRHSILCASPWGPTDEKEVAEIEATLRSLLLSPEGLCELKSRAVHLAGKPLDQLEEKCVLAPQAA